MKRLLRCAVALLAFSAPVAAQDGPVPPKSATEPRGFIAEPDALTRAVLFADRHLGKGDLTNGIYVDYGNLVPGAGWLSAGPGYRHWYGKDALFVDASASMSIHSFKSVQARAELPKLLKRHLVVGAQAKWQDFRDLDYFGVGAETPLALRSDFDLESTHAAAYATLRPIRSVDIDAQVGWMNPKTQFVAGPLFAPIDERTFVPTELGVTLDTRDFAGHPTRGLLLRGAATRFDDRTDGTHTFNRYEGELAGFVPIAGGRAVLGVHGWLVRSDIEPGRSVPFYLQPSLGGVNSLRAFTDYRFHDDNMLLATAELRLAIMTHLDVAMFADAGNVARHARDLDLDKRGYGAGLRLHTRRDTFASIDVTRGVEGWRAIVRLKDPLQLGRLNRKTSIAPFVP